MKTNIFKSPRIPKMQECWINSTSHVFFFVLGGYEGCRSPSFQHGYMSFNKPPLNRLYYPVGTVATLHCWRNLNVVVNGSKTTTCQSSGHWRPGPPNCVIDGTVLLFF